MDKLFHLRFPDRIIWIFPKNTLFCRKTVYVVYSIPGDPIHLGTGRQKGQSLKTGSIEKGRKLCSYIAPQGGICFFQDMRYPGFPCPAHRLVHCGIGSLCIQVPRLRIQDQHPDFGRYALQITVRFCNDFYLYPCCRKLYPRIQRPGKIICNNQ